MRAIMLGAKFDECPACHQAGPHLLLRKTHWFTVFRIPVFLLWVGHGILCPECGHYEGIRFSAMRRAMHTGRLPLGRSRPGFEAAVRQHLGGAAPEDWAAFGLPVGASREAIHARWREIAKKLHPDVGGDAAAFVRIQAIHGRLSRAQDPSVGAIPDAGEVFDPIVKNPKRGFFDAYLKVWPVLAALVLVVSASQSGSATGSTGSNGYPLPTGATPPAGLSGTAHTCWATGSTIYGCLDNTSSRMLFGTQEGTRVTCWFVEPLDPSESVRCSN